MRRFRPADAPGIRVTREGEETDLRPPKKVRIEARWTAEKGTVRITDGLGNREDVSWEDVRAACTCRGWMRSHGCTFCPRRILGKMLGFGEPQKFLDFFSDDSDEPS